MSSPIGFDRCENGNYNTQVACETSGQWWSQGVETKCVYCADGKWTGGLFNGRKNCQADHGNDPAIYMTGTYYLYDIIFFTLNHTYTYKYTFLFHSFIHFF